MPPKAKLSKEEIIATATQITRELGPDAITAREIGKRLQSSARPIFTVFKSMDEVHKQVIDAARQLYKEYVKKGLQQDKAFFGVGSAYIEFARNEPNLFQLLFMSEQGTVSNIEGVLLSIECNYDEIIRSVQEPYQLSTEEAKKLYEHLWIYSHGIATMSATKLCTFSSDQIKQMLTEVFLSILHAIKGGELR